MPLKTGIPVLQGGEDVNGPSFRCGECSRVCRTLGRKKTAAGWRCAGCHQAREQRKTSKGAA